MDTPRWVGRQVPERSSLLAKLGIQPDNEELAWQRDAACRDEDPAIFFPDKGTHIGEAKAVCGRCPVLAQCRSWVLENRIRHGIWAGLTEKERRPLLAERRGDGAAA